MGKMIYAGTGKSKPKKKPGWKEQAAQEAEWLKKINSTSLFGGQVRKYGGRVDYTKKVSPVVEGTLPTQARLSEKVGQSISTPGGNAVKKVIRPELMYRDNPELLERELKARERKFATAPAYNKGGDVLVTDEMMKDITAGKTRRR